MSATATAPKAAAPSRTVKRPRTAVAKAKAASHEASGIAATLERGVEKIASGLRNVFASRPIDTVAALKLDHEALRNFLGVLKDARRDMTERRRAYALFSALLKSHSDAEEKAVYAPVSELHGREMHLKVAEGYVEHQVAKDLMKRIEAATEPVKWGAHANVLAESVEHHLDEEERELFPQVRKNASAEVDAAMLKEYVALRASSQRRAGKKNGGVLAKVKAAKSPRPAPRKSH